MSAGTIKPVDMSRIRVDGGTQQRVALNEAAVAEYRERYDAGEEPEKKPVVFFDGSDYWLGDGFHRYFANKARAAATMLCDVRQGTRRDAVLFSTAANANNAVQRSPADKRRAVETLLADEEWAAWSDRAISEHVRVSPTTVGDVRRAMAAAGASVHAGQVRTYERGGRQVRVDTTNIGKGKPATATAPADDDRPFDGLDRLVQSVHGDPTARASDNVTSMRGDGDDHDAPASPTDTEPTAHQQAEADCVEARSYWAAQVKEIVYGAVQRDTTGCRLLAMIGLEMGDVGQALGEWECDTAEQGRKITTELHPEQIAEAIDCEALNPGPLIRRLLGDRVEHLLALFSSDADPVPLSPLFVALAEGWGENVPPEPKLEDFLPKVPAAWLKTFSRRLGKLSAGYDKSPLDNLDMSVVRGLRDDVVDANACATQYYADWLHARPTADVAEPAALTDERPSDEGSADQPAEKDSEAGAAAGSDGDVGGYDSSHPWYYKLGGRKLAAEEIEASDLTNWDAETSLKLPNSGPKRRAKIEAATVEATKELERDIKRYRDLVERGWDAVTDPPALIDHGDDGSASTLDTALSLTHNHVCYSKGKVARLRAMLDVTVDTAPATPPATTSVQAIPPKPAGQSMTWYQWADRTAGSCRTLGLDVEQILPTDFAVGLFNEGLKPKQAALKYAEQQARAIKADVAEKSGEAEPVDVDLGQGKKIADDVLAVLRKATCTGVSVALPPERIHRSLYTRVNKTLELLGGKWSKGFQTHVFTADPRPLLDAVIASGRVVDRKQALAFFETPEGLADRVAELADVEHDHWVLEPSAGTGRLVRAVLGRAMRAQVTAVEIDPDHADALSGICDDVLRGDFLTVDMAGYGPFDRIVANPPYLGQAWKKHVDRMIELLKPHGRLVCVLPSTAALHRPLQKSLLATMCEIDFLDVPDGTFAESGTDAKTCILVARKQPDAPTTESSVAGEAADDFDDGEQVFAAYEVNVSLKTVEQVDAFDTILTASKPVAVIRSVPALGRRWAVLGTKMVRGRECWRLAALDASSKSDLAGSAAMAAADRGEFDGIAVVDKTDGSKRRRICASDITPRSSVADVIYVRMDDQGANHANA